MIEVAFAKSVLITREVLGAWCRVLGQVLSMPGLLSESLSDSSDCGHHRGIARIHQRVLMSTYYVPGTCLHAGEGCGDRSALVAPSPLSQEEARLDPRGRH